MKEKPQSSLFCFDSCLHVRVSSSSPFIRHLLSGSAREQVVPSVSLVCARCWIGSINETNLKTKVQTLADASSPPPAVPCLEACQPISGQDHRKSPSARGSVTAAEADVLSGAEEV